jgi:niacin transporter
MMFHFVPNAGSVILPMHIPVLLCGLLCGAPSGLICGVVTPLLSSILTGMPPVAILPPMLCELAVYGLASGYLFGRVRTGKAIVDTYAALIGAMIAGRVVAGILKALIFSVGSYSMQIWLTSSFVTAIPGIVIQLLVIPVIIGTLRLTKLAVRNS